MAPLMAPVVALLMLAGVQAGDIVDRSGFLSKADAADALYDYYKFITPNVAPTAQGKNPVVSTAASTKEFESPKIADSEEKHGISLSAIGVGLLSLAAMLGIRLRRGLQPATASSIGLGPEMPLNTTSALGGNATEMKSQSRVGWSQLSSQNSSASTLCYAGSVIEKPVVDAKPAAVRDLTGNIPDCPATIWNADNIDIAAEKAKAVAQGPLPQCPAERVAPSPGLGVEYFRENSEQIIADLKTHGCLWFRGFDLMKDEAGFRQWYEAVGLDPCLDPIHTSGLRSFASQSDAIYEEVNKQSLSQHYIGLHQESTHKKTATYGAFVCFKPATEKGGEFMICDAAKMARDLDPEVAQRIYDRKIRISVSNLDMNFLEATGPLKEPLMEGARVLVDQLVAPKFDMDLEMKYGADGKPMRMQAIEQVASPFNRHPETGELLWFCNIHNHARYLRDNRPCTVPEVGMTEVFFGDLSPISTEDLDHINAVSEANIQRIPMQPGDVLLCDNYRVLHGRDIFWGDRYHAVSWFGGLVKDRPEGYDDSNDNSKPGDFLNKIVNKFVVSSI